MQQLTCYYVNTQDSPKESQLLEQEKKRKRSVINSHSKLENITSCWNFSPMTLKTGQGHINWYEQAKASWGYRRAKFEIFHFKYLKKSQHYFVFFCQIWKCQLLPSHKKCNECDIAYARNNNTKFKVNET